MAGLLFGTGGTPHSARTGSTVDGIERIAELGLGCMEIEFVQGVKMGEGAARLVAEVASRKGVKLSAHAPYFINLNAHDLEKVRASQDRILQTARIASVCGAESIVFHPAFYLDDPPEEAYERVKQHLVEVLNQLKRENNPVCIRLEVTGKDSQFGTLEEVLRLSTELEGVAPCIDFAHWHARTGKFNSYSEFAAILLQVRERLGGAALDNMHIHVSGISYGKKGEVNHLNLAQSDLRYTELLSALKDYEVKGMVICESPNLEEDALLLQTTYCRF
ncbi:MAG TPA: TIM barrel protein [Dehalococcoidia bacterium]|jgi:deoxyribonuclease-4|nr:TIM barrel protein [Dehalococcoidia bacterium]